MDRERRTLRSLISEFRIIPFLEDIAAYIGRLRPGDQVILFILGCIVVVVSLASLVALDRSILVTRPAYGGSLTEGEVGAPRYINPLLAISDTDQDLSALTYSGLMGRDAKGDLVPVLAKSYIVSDDGKTYQFTLRSNLKFSDGSPVTADDVVFTVQKAKDSVLKSPAFGNWAGISVRALDAKTVQFTLPAPDATFLQQATLGVLPAHLWRNTSDEEFPFSDLMIKPVGTGPFVTSHVSVDKSGAITSYDLKANPNYPLGRPYLDAMHFQFYQDRPALQAAFNAGQVDSGYGILGPREETAPYARVFAVFFNAGQNDLLKSQAVRQALSVAIDRDAIVKDLFNGYATPVAGPVPPGSGVAVSTIPSADRLASSTAILQGAGWSYATSTQSWKNKSGQTLSVTLKTSNVPELKSIAQAVQADWKQLGVPTALQLYEPGDLAETVIRPRSFQALLFGMVIGQGDDLYAFWDSKAKDDPGLNVTGYSNPTVDKLLEELRVTTDPQTRTKDLSQINQIIAADYPAAFIESPDFVYAVPKNLKGVILPQIASPADRFATVATWYRRSESVWPFLAHTR